MTNSLEFGGETERGRDREKKREERIGGRIIWEEKEFVIRVYLYMNMIINGESGRHLH